MTMNFREKQTCALAVSNATRTRPGLRFLNGRLLKLLRQGKPARLGCACVLLLASGFKLHQLATDPALGVLYGSQWVQLGIAQYEIILAAWLLSALREHHCRAVAIGTFAIFGVISLTLALSGTSSCGCFGRFHVDPWYSFGLDLAAVVVLWLWNPTRPSNFARSQSGGYLLASLIVVGCIVAPMALSVRPSSSEIAVDGVVVGNSFVLLEPQKWLGNRFPLIDYVDIGEQLSGGSWIVIFYRHDCPKCKESLARYTSFGGDATTSEISQFALIELPPHPRNLNEISSSWQIGQVSDAVEWFIDTPCEIRLRDGQVVAVSSGTEPPVLRLE